MQSPQSQFIWQPVKANGQAAIFFNSKVELVLRPKKQDNTDYHILGQAVFDEHNTGHKDVFAKDAMAISARLPHWKMEDMKIGDKISLNGKEWEVLQTSAFPKLLRISDGTQEITLEEGKRLNIIPSGHPEARWKVHFGNENYLEEVLTGKPGIGGPDRIWIYEEERETIEVGGKAAVPSVFQGSITLADVADTRKLPAEFRTIKLEGLPFIGEDGKEYNFYGHAIELSVSGAGSRIYTDGMGVKGEPMRMIYIMPGSQHEIFADPDADGTFGIYRRFEVWGELGQTNLAWVAEIRNDALLFEEESLSNSFETNKHQFGIRLFRENGGYQFADASGGAKILFEGQEFAPPFHTPHGSAAAPKEIGRNSAVLNFSLEPVTALLKIDAPVHIPQQQGEGGEEGEKKEFSFELAQNYPNPFRAGTAISYSLAKDCSMVNLEVFDVFGRKVKEIVGQGQLAGEYKFAFEGKGLPSGTYVYRLVADNQLIGTRKMAIVK